MGGMSFCAFLLCRFSSAVIVLGYNHISVSVRCFIGSKRRVSPFLSRACKGT